MVPALKMSSVDTNKNNPRHREKVQVLCNPVQSINSVVKCSLSVVTTHHSGDRSRPLQACPPHVVDDHVLGREEIDVEDRISLLRVHPRGYEVPGSQTLSRESPRGGKERKRRVSHNGETVRFHRSVLKIWQIFP